MQKGINPAPAKKGFTIIELLVVVSIIAVLTGIVLVNVTIYINRGKDSAAKGNLSSMVTNGAVFYGTSGNYTNFFTGTNPATITTTADCAGDNGFVRPCQALISAGYTSIDVSCAGTSCTSGTTGWCAMVTKKADTNTFCVDSSGSKIDKPAGSCASGVCS